MAMAPVQCHALILESEDPLTSAIQGPGTISHGHFYSLDCAVLGIESRASRVQARATHTPASTLF